MAVSSPYATASEYRAHGTVNKESTDDEDQITTSLVAVSRHIDRVTGRFFGQEEDVTCTYVTECATGRGRPFDWAESENPYRWGGFSRTLDVDDFVSVAEIRVDDDTDGVCELVLAATDYELTPRNAALGPEPGPYKYVEIPSWSTFGGFRHGMKVELDGTRGWPAVPAAIKEATIQLTGLLRIESPRATQQVTEMGTTLGMSKAARDILDSLIKGYGRRQVIAGVR